MGAQHGVTEREWDDGLRPKRRLGWERIRVYYAADAVRRALDWWSTAERPPRWTRRHRGEKLH